MRLVKKGNIANRQPKMPKSMAQIVDFIPDEYQKYISQKDYNQLNSFLRRFDYRYIALYFWALKNKRINIINNFKILLSSTNSVKSYKHIYKIAIDKFKRGEVKHNLPRLTGSIEQIFNLKNKETIIYVIDSKYMGNLTKLWIDIGGDFHEFIEERFDLPGMNAVIRQGIVKTWNLPDGTKVVSKRQNYAKPERFKREMLNHQEFIEKKINLRIKLKKGNTVQIVNPFALIKDGRHKSIYAIYKEVNGKSLEEIFYDEKSKKIRRQYLRDFKEILEVLYGQGIVWGDMSPRNIIVKGRGKKKTYYLIDFEKTSVDTLPISSEARMEHTRGQIFIEELCVVCGSEEIISVLGNQFNPSGWDTASKKKISYKLRPDITAILKARELKDVKEGYVNSLDKQIINIRKPYVDDHANKIFYPGVIGFKVEHYLSCAGDAYADDYERKLTEVLIASKDLGYLKLLVPKLINKTENIENVLVRLEFQEILSKSSFQKSLKNECELKSLKKMIDKLFEERLNRANIEKFLNSIAE